MSKSSSRQPLFFRLTLDDRLLLACQRLCAIRPASNGNNHTALEFAGQLLEVKAPIRHCTGGDCFITLRVNIMIMNRCIREMSAANGRTRQIRSNYCFVAIDLFVRPYSVS